MAGLTGCNSSARQGQNSGQSHQAQLACLVLTNFLFDRSQELSSKRFLLVLTTARLEKDTNLWNKKETYL